jgi:hypothetical protein
METGKKKNTQHDDNAEDLTAGTVSMISLILSLTASLNKDSVGPHTVKFFWISQRIESESSSTQSPANLTNSENVRSEARQTML